METFDINQKRVLTFDEAVKYTGFTPSYLHKLTGQKKIPFSKPNGKAIFFDRKELEKWLTKSSPLETQFIEIPKSWLRIFETKKAEDVFRVVYDLLCHANGVLPLPLKTEGAKKLFGELRESYFQLLSGRDEECDTVQTVKINIYDFILNNRLREAEELSIQWGQKDEEDLSF